MQAIIECVKQKYEDERRTEIVDSDSDFTLEELTPEEDVVVTISHSGYIKRVPLSTYRAQRRGGKGRAGMSTREGEQSILNVIQRNRGQLREIIS